MSALLITIRSTEGGYYHWHLWDGPDGAFEFSGNAPLLERCFEEIIRAQRSLAEHFTADPDSEADWLPDPSTDPTPIPKVHPTAGAALPAYQDVPASPHPAQLSSSIYPRPSSFG